MPIARENTPEVRVALSYGLLFFFGVWGMHRFYLGRYTTAIIYAFTGGIFGLGIIYDVFAIPGMCKELRQIE